MNELVDQAIESCARLLGEKPVHAGIQRPGSQAVRLRLGGGTVIAARRESSGRAKLEAHVLEALRRHGAPVPAPLARDGPWLLQEDVGADRLSHRLDGAWEAEGERWLEAALTALSRVHLAAAQAGLQDRAARIGAGAGWLGELIDTPRRIGRFLEVPCPRLDDHRLAYAVNVPGSSFVKWNASPAAAAARPDWTVAWFDWRQCGRRNRLDDVARLLADETVPDWPVAESRLLAGHIGGFDEGRYPGGPYAYLRAFGSLHMAARLSVLIKEMMRRGTWDYRPGSGLSLGPPRPIRNLLARARRWAGATPATRPLADWYEAVAEAVRPPSA